MTRTDNLDIVSAAWILASNDENFMISYEGIKHRLGLDSNFAIEDLIRLHGELFRQRVPREALESWRNRMLEGQYQPSWIKTIQNQEERFERVRKLTVDDFFRSQFRAIAGSPASDISIINWGLEHIERIRKSSLETKQERTKKVTNILIPILSTCISLVAVIAGCVMQKETIKSQAILKKTELEYKSKQDGYTGFMKNMTTAYIAARQNNRESLNESLDNIETAIYNLNNLLSDEKKNKIWIEFQKFSEFCYNANSSTLTDLAFADTCVVYKHFFKEYLQQALNEQK